MMSYSAMMEPFHPDWRRDPISRKYDSYCDSARGATLTKTLKRRGRFPVSHAVLFPMRCFERWRVVARANAREGSGLDRLACDYVHVRAPVKTPTH